MNKYIMTGKIEDDPLMPTYNRLAKEKSEKYRVYVEERAKRRLSFAPRRFPPKYVTF